MARFNDVDDTGTLDADLLISRGGFAAMAAIADTGTRPKPLAATPLYSFFDVTNTAFATDATMRDA